MPPRTRPTNTHVSNNDDDGEVYNYLHDTMAVLLEHGPPSDISPWLLTGPPSTSMYDADMEFTNLHFPNSHMLAATKSRANVTWDIGADLFDSRPTHALTSSHMSSPYQPEEGDG